MKTKRSVRTDRLRWGCGCLLVVLVVLAVSVSVGGILLLLKPVGDTGNDFLVALQNEDYQAAYTLLATDLQDEFGDETGLRALIREFRLQPQSWTLNSYSMNGNTGAIIGQIELPEGNTVSLRLQLRSTDTHWKITDFWFGDYNQHSLKQ